VPEGSGELIAATFTEPMLFEPAFSPTLPIVALPAGRAEAIVTGTVLAIDTGTVVAMLTGNVVDALTGTGLETDDTTTEPIVAEPAGSEEEIDTGTVVAIETGKVVDALTGIGLDAVTVANNGDAVELP